MSYLSAVSAGAGSFELAVFWVEAKIVLSAYVIPAAVAIGIIRIIQVLSQQIKAHLESAQTKSVGKQKIS